MNSIVKYIVMLATVVSIAFISGCESNLPHEYIEKNYVEGFLIIDQKIEGIKILQSQPLDKQYNVENAWIKDADVKIISGGKEMELLYREQEPRGYFLPDTGVKVLPDTKYRLEILLKDKTLITAETNTPASRFEWVRPPVEYMQFPKDTINQPSDPAYDLEWTSDANVPFYLLSVNCLDTAGYGVYLDPPLPNVMNRRIYNLFYQDQEEQYYDHTTWNLIANIKTPVVWLAFKWFGRHDVTIYAPDDYFLQWFLKMNNFSGTTEYNDLGSNIRNGIGVFGSAAKISGVFFVLKNQP